MIGNRETGFEEAGTGVDHCGFHGSAVCTRTKTLTLGFGLLKGALASTLGTELREARSEKLQKKKTKKQLQFLAGFNLNICMLLLFRGYHLNFFFSFFLLLAEREILAQICFCLRKKGLESLFEG